VSGVRTREGRGGVEPDVASSRGRSLPAGPPRWSGEPTHDCPKCGRIVGPLHIRTEYLLAGRRVRWLLADHNPDAPEQSLPAHRRGCAGWGRRTIRRLARRPDRVPVRSLGV
jgi:hypothetical protein